MKGARAETSPCARAGKGARARNGALCEKGQGMNYHFGQSKGQAGEASCANLDKSLFESAKED